MFLYCHTCKAYDSGLRTICIIIKKPADLTIYRLLHHTYFPRPLLSLSCTVLFLPACACPSSTHTLSLRPLITSTPCRSIVVADGSNVYEKRKPNGFLFCGA